MKMHELTNLEKFMFQMIFINDIKRYLSIFNEPGYSYERSEIHHKIAKTLTRIIIANISEISFDDYGKIFDIIVNEQSEYVYDMIKDNITDCLDESIGFPLNETIYGKENYNKYAIKFISNIFLLYPKMCNKIKKEL